MRKEELLSLTNKLQTALRSDPSSKINQKEVEEIREDVVVVVAVVEVLSTHSWILFIFVIGNNDRRNNKDSSKSQTDLDLEMDSCTL